jgi:hypothetical protein
MHSQTNEQELHKLPLLYYLFLLVIFHFFLNKQLNQIEQTTTYWCCRVNNTHTQMAALFNNNLDTTAYSSYLNGRMPTLVRVHRLTQ